MKIAIHYSKGSFSERWIAYCENNYIEYKLVNAYANDIIQQVEDCDGFMWHFHQGDYRDMQFAKALIFSLETKGIFCFPDSHTCWHFDNKIWEKYLLESIGAPLVSSFVFYTEKEALAWVRQVEFPKVFKLKGGAGASNVRLANNRKEAERLIKQSFGKGFIQFRWKEKLKEEWGKFRQGKSTFRDVLRPIKFALNHYPTKFSHYHQNEIGYAFFQEFIPNNAFDIRVIVIGDKAFAIKRLVRKNDFRASGSGIILYDHNDIPESCVQISFQTSKKLNTQCLAYDYVLGKNKEPLIVEISYGFAMLGYDLCPGFWTNDMVWHEEKFCPQNWMVDNLVNKIKLKK